MAAFNSDYRSVSAVAADSDFDKDVAEARRKAEILGRRFKYEAAESLVARQDGERKKMDEFLSCD